MAHVIAQNASILNVAISTANAVWDAFVVKMVLSTKRVQIGQLTHAMKQMTDAQLAEVGITRSEIEDYASMTIRVYG